MPVRPLLIVLVAASALAACSAGDGARVEPEVAPATPTATATVGSPGTPAGSVLALGQPGTVAWRVDATTTGTLELVVEDVRRRPGRVLAGWVPQDEARATTPYFVTGTVTNAGDADLGGASLPLYLRDATGVLTPPVTFGSDYARCPSAPLPEPFAAGESAEVCLVYTLPAGDRPAALAFQPTSSGAGVVWTLR